jgi:protein-tyrosine-phosphatase
MAQEHLRTLRGMLLFGKSSVKLLTAFSTDPDQQDRDVEDPYGGPLEMYQASLNVIQPAVEGLVEWLLAQPGITEK